MSLQLDKVHKFLSENQLDAMLITKPENLRYFSGFSGSSGVLLITAEQASLLTDFRYIEQAQTQAPSFDIVKIAGSPYETLSELAAKAGLKRVGFEGEFVTYDAHRRLEDCFAQAELVPYHLDRLRAIKTEKEIALIRQAAQIADKAFQEVLRYIKPGVKEIDVAAELEYRMRQLNSERPAFDTIIASGKRSALPHGVASEKVIETGDLVTLDFGAVYQGYHSDMTRTVAVGSASAKQKLIYRHVLEAQLAGLQAVASGIDCGKVDETARRLIQDAGYGDYFGHGLGHSVGLAIHEEPRLSPSAAGILLETGMVVTVEPGIYLPDWGGVRIEDLVVVTASGCEILSASSKELIELE